jgi:Conserved hypothetical protein 698
MRCQPLPGRGLNERQIAPSTASMPNLRARRGGQAPKPRSGAPKARGLTAPAAPEAQSDVPSEAKRNRQPCLRTTVNDVPGLYMHDRFSRELEPHRSRRFRWRAAFTFPVFIVPFPAASLITTLGLTGGHAEEIQLPARWIMVVALAAVGLQLHWRAFAAAGARPLLLAGLTWFAVAASSLAVRAFSQQQ